MKMPTKNEKYVETVSSGFTMFFVIFFCVSHFVCFCTLVSKLTNGLMPAIPYVQTITKKKMAKNLMKKWRTVNNYKSITIHYSQSVWILTDFSGHTKNSIDNLRDQRWNTKCEKTVSQTGQVIWWIMSCTLFILCFEVFSCFCTFFAVVCA